ncbi:YheC/YheD family protein [Aneurinibacillus tyrosinisolvens]|uniref:YheC/YheD family protein n=1 Tax=Aneurinibacillus tyrosinisolvens TaxID=1443435 RepID=UPI0034E1E789
MSEHGESVSLKHGRIIRLGYDCNRICDRYRYDWQIGYDIGIDSSRKIWLIEANRRTPSHALFARLEDKTIYRKIKHMASLYNKGSI